MKWPLIRRSSHDRVVDKLLAGHREMKDLLNSRSTAQKSQYTKEMDRLNLISLPHLLLNSHVRRITILTDNRISLSEELLSLFSGVKIVEIKKGCFDDSQYSDLKLACEKLSDLNIYVEEEETATI